MSVRKRTWASGESWQVDVMELNPAGEQVRVRRNVPAASEGAAQRVETLIRAAIMEGRPVPRTFTPEGTVSEKQKPARAGGVFMEESWARFARDVLAGHAANTQKVRRQQWARIAPVLGSSPVTSIHTNDLERLWTALISGKGAISPKSAKEVVKFARQLAAREDPERLIRLPRMRVPDSDLPHWQREEIEAIREKITIPEILAAFLLMVRCGMRVGEVRGLRWADVSVAKQSIRIERQMHDDGAIGPPKHGRRRSVFVPSDALAAVRALPKSGLFVIAHPGSGAVWSRQKIGYRIAQACAAAGVRVARNHAGRRSFATGSAELGIKTVAIRDNMGHQNTSTTDGYIRKVAGGQVRPEFEQLATAQEGTGHGTSKNANRKKP
jgi:integrase